MPIFEFLGLIFEWHNPKFELVNNERGNTVRIITAFSPSKEQKQKRRYKYAKRP